MNTKNIFNHFIFNNFIT